MYFLRLKTQLECLIEFISPWNSKYKDNRTKRNSYYKLKCSCDLSTSFDGLKLLFSNVLFFPNPLMLDEQSNI